MLGLIGRFVFFLRLHYAKCIRYGFSLYSFQAHILVAQVMTISTLACYMYLGFDTSFHCFCFECSGFFRHWEGGKRNLTIAISYLKKTFLTILLGIRYYQIIDIMYLPFGRTLSPENKSHGQDLEGGVTANKLDMLESIRIFEIIVLL